jgi:hemolysin III
MYLYAMNPDKKAGHHEIFHQADEEHMHFFTHLLGVLFILFFGHYLWNAEDLSPRLQLGLMIYLFTFLGVFLASSAYHLHYLKDHKTQLRKIDHSAIYFFIAGSNTPYLLGFTDGHSGLLFLILMWTLVAFGLIIKWMEVKMPDWISLIYYLFMGWLGIVTMYLIFHEIQLSTLILIIAGGLLYSIGAYFYRYDQIKWYHSIWHLFVLGGAITHFLAIYWQINLV